MLTVAYEPQSSLLDGLDEELLFELDGVVRDNQLARSPFARSGRAELLLHEQNPELADDVYEERQIRIREMAFKATIKEYEKRTASYKTRFGSLDDTFGTSPTADKATRQKAKMTRNEPFSPDLRPKTSLADLMFKMDGDEDLHEDILQSPSPKPTIPSNRDELEYLPPLSTPQSSIRAGIVLDTPASFPISPPSASRPIPSVSTLSSDVVPKQTPPSANPWGSSALPISRLDLREVLAESKPGHSALSAGLAAQSREASSKATPQKLSQKERKRQLQQQAEQAAQQEVVAKQESQLPWSKTSNKKDAPWKKTMTEPTVSANDLLRPESVSTARPPHAKPLVSADVSSNSLPRRAASPDTRFSGQKSGSTPKPSPGSSSASPKPIMPHSKSYIQRAPIPEQEAGLALADIIGQQQREQQRRREAVAKRSLQEIQQEQEFQEWWDQESRRTQEEEARRLAREENKEKKKDGGRRGRGSNKSRGGSRSGGGKSGNNSGATGAPETSFSGSKGKAKANRGKN